MKLAQTFFVLGILSFMLACNSDDDDMTMIDVPVNYQFTRNNTSSVSFSGQTTRILMGEELIGALKDFGQSELTLLEMYTNETADGNDANPFSDASLNVSTKSIRSKVAASTDFFTANTVDATIIKTDFSDWISAQVNEVFPNENELAEAGKAGQIADGTSTRYINAQGLEYDQLVNKGLIGALMVDQMLNNYLSPAVLDAANNITDNDAGTLVEGNNYTAMEHKWDEAYGYLYGNSANPASPNETLGADDSFLNKYIGRIKNDPDFAGIENELFEAFKTGRAAIAAGEYDIRDEQANLIRKKISEVIGIRAVYYLMQSITSINNNNPGTAFHDLSEGYGFIYSLQFTRMPDTDRPYFSKEEVDLFLADLLDDGPNGLWDVNINTLETIANEIADRFDFTVAQAAE